MSTDSRAILGRLGERLAAEHVERLGWRIVARNHRTRIGEIDLIGVDGDVLVFVEVKTCRPGRFAPWDNLHDRKRSQVRRLAGAWLREGRERPYFATLRFDAIGVVIDAGGGLVRLDHLEGAF
jgi:putative endonuclease